MGKFLEGMFLGAVTGVALGIIFDPVSEKDKKAVMKKIDRRINKII